VARKGCVRRGHNEKPAKERLFQASRLISARFGERMPLGQLRHSFARWRNLDATVAHGGGEALFGVHLP